MNFREYLCELFLYLAIFPGACICYLPVKNQLKDGWRKKIAFLSLLSIILVLTAPLIVLKLDMNDNLVFYGMLLLYFVAYQSTLKVPVSKSIHLFLLAIALMCYASNYTNYAETLLYPQSSANEVHITTGLLHLTIGILLAVLLAYPLTKYVSWLIENFALTRVWNIASVILVFFIICNMLMVPYGYETLYTKRVFPLYPVLLTLLFALMLFIYILFYFIAIEIMNASRNTERIRLLEMQEKQYLSLKKHIEETMRLRHDFRHTINVLKHLSGTKEYDALDRYLDGYISSAPPETFTNYTKNIAVNALLNYYSELAQQARIMLDWQIALPEDSGTEDYDLCSILGNILDNCIGGCKTMPEEKRYHRLAITTSHNTYLYIVSVNCFDGHVRQIGETYLSTHSGGSGIGLSSILAIAEKYGGSARFHHDKEQFYMDILLPMGKRSMNTRDI